MSDLPALLENKPQYIREFVINPQTIVNKLDEYVIGQHQAKRMLAIAEFQRQIRVFAKTNIIKMDVEFQKQNVLMIGATGSGKTALVQAFAKITRAPLTTYDVTSITRAGYIGNKVEDILIRHVNSHYSDLDTKSWSHIQGYLERGIIYLDEFDKIKVSKDGGNDVNGRTVQQALLKVLEEGTVNLDDKVPVYAEEFYTGDLLCICSGAFVGLEEIVQQRLTKNSGMGFSGEIFSKAEFDKQDLFSQVINEDLVQFGVIPEVLGRIPILAKLKELSVDDLIRIITEPKNSIYKQYESLFKTFGVKLNMEATALAEVAKMAKAKKTGARALKNILAQLFEDYQFNIFDKDYGETLTITIDDVKERVNANSAH